MVPRNETSRLYVEPPGDEDEITWMEGFADEIEAQDAALAQRLRDALDGDDPWRASGRPCAGPSSGTAGSPTGPIACTT